MRDLIKRIKEILNINIENKSIRKDDMDGTEVLLMDGIDEYSKIEVSLVVYDCKNGFEYERLKKFIDDGVVGVLPVVFFENWDNQKDVTDKIYSGMKNAKDRKDYLAFLKKVVPIYKNKEKLYLEVDKKGINYLEYESDGENDKIRGYIYNVSLGELRKLFNVTGNYLFKNNVRYGLSSNVKGSKLRESFKQYIYNSLKEEVGILKTKGFEGDMRIIEEYLESEIDKESKLHVDNFWFHHNGVTIFVGDESGLETPVNKVKLDPSKVSVINGAQTLSNFYEVEREVFKSLELLLIDSGKDEIGSIKKIISEIGYKIIVKTIIVVGDELYITSITHGLNTQIPIGIEDLIANEDEVEMINKKLQTGKNKKYKVVKAGEEWHGEKGINVLDFAKYYCSIKNEPGKGKNLNKNRLEDVIKEVKIELEKGNNDIVKKLTALLEVYKWWDLNIKYSKNQTVTNDKAATIKKYGKNYFGAYVLLLDEDSMNDLNEDFLMYTYERFEKNILSERPNVELGDFKKDDLFNIIKGKVIQMDDRAAHELQVISKTILDKIKMKLKSENQSL